MNLYLYLPSTSAHPPGVLKGLIFGNLQRYWYQNTYKEDFITISALFVDRLVARGYNIETLSPLFQEAAELIISKQDLHAHTDLPTLIDRNLDTKAERETLYFHVEYHPRGISRRLIRSLYSTYLEKHSGFKKMIVCYSRPKNLRDKLIKTALPNTPGYNPLDILHSIKEL